MGQKLGWAGGCSASIEMFVRNTRPSCASRSKELPPCVPPWPRKGGCCVPLNAGGGRERGKLGQTGARRLLPNTPA